MYGFTARWLIEPLLGSYLDGHVPSRDSCGNERFHLYGREGGEKGDG